VRKAVALPQPRGIREHATSDASLELQAIPRGNVSKSTAVQPFAGARAGFKNGGSASRTHTPRRESRGTRAKRCTIPGDTQLGEYGASLGIAFQIADDILDCAGQTQETGKIPGTDLREGTPTMPLLLAAQSDELVRAAHHEGHVATGFRLHGRREEPNGQ